MDELMMALTNQHDDAASMLSSIEVNKRDPILLICLCPQARVVCKCLLISDWKRERQWIFECLIVLY